MKNAIKFEIYRGDDGGYRWRGKRNGKITCTSGEGNGYKQRAMCRKSLVNMLNTIIDGRYTAENPEDVESG